MGLARHTVYPEVDLRPVASVVREWAWPHAERPPSRSPSAGSRAAGGGEAGGGAGQQRGAGDGDPGRHQRPQGQGRQRRRALPHPEGAALPGGSRAPQRHLLGTQLPSIIFP